MGLHLNIRPLATIVAKSVAPKSKGASHIQIPPEDIPERLAVTRLLGPTRMRGLAIGHMFV
jgi:hypothetical protein